MTTENGVDRHSKASDAELITDPDELAHAEARNVLRQFDQVVEMIDYFLQPERAFQFRPSHLLTLHRAALQGISAYSGNFRPAGVQIGGSKHQPVGAHLVPEKVEEMCEYVNANWKQKSPLHLAAYVLWRLNWIHPFTDGNGRTARAASYLVLCTRLGYRLPGTNSVVHQIAKDKKPYYKALEAADAAYLKAEIDLRDLETYLDALLANQLVGIHNDANSSRS